MIYSKFTVNTYDKKKLEVTPDKYLGSKEPNLSELMQDEVFKTLIKSKKMTVEQLKEIAGVS